MNAMQVIGPLRPLLVYLISALAFKYVTPDQVGPLADLVIQIAAGIATLVMMIWSFRDHSTDRQIDRVASMPKVQVVEADDEHVAESPLLTKNPKVIPKKVV